MKPTHYGVPNNDAADWVDRWIYEVTTERFVAEVEQRLPEGGAEADLTASIEEIDALAEELITLSDFRCGAFDLARARLLRATKEVSIGVYVRARGVSVILRSTSGHVLVKAPLTVPAILTTLLVAREVIVDTPTMKKPDVARWN